MNKTRTYCELVATEAVGALATQPDNGRDEFLIGMSDWLHDAHYTVQGE